MAHEQCPLLIRPQTFIRRSLGRAMRALSNLSYSSASAAVPGFWPEAPRPPPPHSATAAAAARSRPELLLPMEQARIIYCSAPASGHNQEGHPECSARVAAVLEHLDKAELTAEKRGRDVQRLVNFRAATKEDIATVHSMKYVEGLGKAMSKAATDGLILIERTGPTYATSTTYDESLLAAGGSLALVDAVVSASEKDSVEPPVGFALIRPPGHHAVPAGPMGFCVFGNVAVAARYAQRVHGLRRVFIIDFDVHHGNGTHDMFYDDPDVFFLSTHQEGSYPGTGKLRQFGRGDGEGSTLNLPLPGGCGHKAMSRVFEEVIAPKCYTFKPDIILVSAGYDAHVLDPLASFQFTTATYYDLAAGIKQLARDTCKGSIADTFRALLGEKSCAHELDNPAVLYEEPDIRRALSEVKAIHGVF